MLYHAHALAAHGVDVDLVGFEGTALPKAITSDPRLRVHRLNPATLRLHGRFRGSTYAAAGLLDATRLSVRLWRTLRTLPRPDLVLVQNPPAFPTLVVSWMSLRGRSGRGRRPGGAGAGPAGPAKFVIDWHNLGFTLLGLRLGRWHPAVRLARWYERRDARRVDANLCVSRALAAFLESRFGVRNASVLYDRPASSFVPMDRAERERFRQALFTRLGIYGGNAGFIVCPTSWTEDEDFDLIIDAVPRLEERIRGWEAAAGGRRFPDLVILVTGDGARRAEFERRFAGLKARRVQLRARWLEPEDYPRVVGSADVGLCLHRSSSGLDIPMKVADLFGAGVPVCALDYGACLAERVRHGDNGLLFSTAVQLADVLFDLFETFPSHQSLLDRLRAGARKSARPTWDEGWDREAKPVLLP
jgi:beta-1,4-mannosyltransferase